MSAAFPAAGDPADTDDLVRRVLGGEIECFGVLVERHETEVWKVAVSVLGDRAAAEELVQQTFVNAYERLGQYEQGRDLGRWLRGIARNQVREKLRNSSRERTYLSHYQHYLLALYDDDDGAERRTREVRAAVSGCRERLSPVAARAVNLHYDEGRPVEEVAALIGRTAAATRQLLFRARTALRDCLQRSETYP